MIETLAKAQNLYTEKTTLNFLNPKSVTRNELYGSIHPATREWKDGLISQIFRDLANCFTVKHEYIVLDGDIDAEWIESMNTVNLRTFLDRKISEIFVRNSELGSLWHRLTCVLYGR